MKYRWLAGQLLAVLVTGYIVFGEPIAGVDPVYTVGIIAVAVFTRIISYYAYKGYRSQHNPTVESKP
ncbi:hypothetical protein SAMN05216388_10881 [Halorientalis persicus]|uniref:Uncharacterized protein n=1 Tax=Halorientalis persicus TaxID=1367881 RepID=A0A1H8WY21_9EURY|nr:hypothetical protein [Halorientalis persicus]SEP32501.1 hypothetical protein SAMN05216388_10881 [Halorientalis persicus]